MEKGRVSIIIPVFNAEKYVEESIESALNQTYTNIEVIVVDDGSTDKSLEIIKKFSKKIKIISNEHRRQPYTLNTGIREMTGEWFKWLSADDVLTPNAIEEQIKQTKNINDKKNWIIASNSYHIDKNGKLLSEITAPNFQEMNNFEFNVMLLHHNVLSFITLLIHKSTLDSYGFFDENFPEFLDWEMVLRFCVLHNVRIFLIPKFLAKTRIHEEQLTKTIHENKRILLREQTRKHILLQLNPSDRKKFESALSQYDQKVKEVRKEIKEYQEINQENRKKIEILRSFLHKSFLHYKSLI